jgi:LmbE family N-acetylglucosaminyl deacetylase
MMGGVGRIRWWYAFGVAVLAAASAVQAAHETTPARALRVGPLTLPPHARVLVFAPHPDDETVALGGFLARLSRQHTPLRVVFVTNGDGYTEAVKEDLDVARPTEADYRRFGRLRQREATNALAHLGVSRRDARFLGFPDGGIAELWQSHWLRSTPYVSPYTKDDEPPYPDCVNPDLHYVGQNLTQAMVGLMRDFAPTVVVMPHPYDSHPDHSHTSFFVTEAMSELIASGGLPPKVTVLTYLVHYASWPATRPPAFDQLVPLREIQDTAWVETQLAPVELSAKRNALAEYRTQLSVMGGFLRTFVVRNELFQTVDPGLLARIASIH